MLDSIETAERLAQELADGTCRITPLRGMVKKHPHALTEARLRNLFLNRDNNGFSDAFLKLGSLVFVVDHRFWKCLIENRGKRLDGGRREQVLAQASQKSKANVKSRKATAPTVEA